MNSREEELLYFLEEELLEVIAERIEKHRKEITENDEYLKIKRQIYDLLESTRSELRPSLLLMEELKTNLEGVVSKELFYQISADFVTTIQIILKR